MGFLVDLKHDFATCPPRHRHGEDAPALVRARVRATAEGSAKPSELARALGGWGSDDPRGEHALVARLGVVEGETAQVRLPQPAAPSSTATV